MTNKEATALLEILEQIEGHRAEACKSSAPEAYSRAVKAQRAFRAGAIALRDVERMVDKCPRCESPDPSLHPAMQIGGEVQPCSDPWHKRALPEEPANETYKLFVWSDYCKFAAVAHAITVAQARELIEAEDLGGTDGSCPERAAARKMIYGQTPGIYRGARAVLMFDTDKAEEPAPWTARDRRLYAALKYARNELIGMANRAEGDEWLADVASRAISQCESVLAATPPPDPRDAALEKAEEALVLTLESYVPPIIATFGPVDFTGLPDDVDVPNPDHKIISDALAAIRAAREGK